MQLRYCVSLICRQRASWPVRRPVTQVATLDDMPSLFRLEHTTAIHFTAVHEHQATRRYGLGLSLSRCAICLHNRHRTKQKKYTSTAESRKMRRHFPDCALGPSLAHWGMLSRHLDKHFNTSPTPSCFVPSRMHAWHTGTTDTFGMYCTQS